MGSNANFILLFFLFQALSEQHPFHLCLVVWNPHNVQPGTQRWAKHPNCRGHSMQVKMNLRVGAKHSRHLDKNEWCPTNDINDRWTEAHLRGLPLFKWQGNCWRTFWAVYLNVDNEGHNYGETKQRDWVAKKNLNWEQQCSKYFHF